MTQSSKPLFNDMYQLLLDPIEPVFLVEGVIEELTTGAIFGPSGGGKTFVIISLICCVATGTPWNGHEVIRQGPVFYFVGEGRSGIPRRVDAWQQYHEVTIPEDSIFMTAKHIEFDESGAQEIATKIRSLAEKLGAPTLLVIDTLARFLPSDSDENSTKDMMKFINIIDALRDELKCCVVIVHHTGHSSESKNRARGSSSFRAAMDWEYLVDKSKFKCTKMKDADEPPEITFNIEKVGDSSAVVVFGEVVGKDGLQKISSGDKKVMTALNEICEKSSKSFATEIEWRDSYYASRKNDSTDTKRKGFSRGKVNLVEKGFVVVDGENYVPEGQSGQSRTKLKMSSG